MAHLGDFDLSAVIYGKFTTYRPSTGASFTLAGSPVLSVYKDNSTTQGTTGVSITADFDSVTGLNHYTIDTSADGTFFSAGSFFDIVITTGTVDSVSVVGSVVASFTLRKNSSLKPTTAGRTLVVDASGLADANAVKVGPTGSGTAQTARDIGASVLLSTGTGTGQLDFTSGVVKANVTQNAGSAITSASGIQEVKIASIAANAITATSIASDAITDAKVASDVTIASVTGAVGSVTGNVGGNVTGSVGSVAAGGITASSLAADAITAAKVAADVGTEIGVAVWAETTRVLTAIDEDTTTLDLDATIRAAVGLASANLDNQLDALPTNAELATALGTADDAVLAQVALVKAVTDRVDTMIELTTDGEIFTALALQNAPGAGSAPSAATIADAVWDEILSGHAISGSTGEALSAAGGAGDPWITALPGTYSAGQAGYIVGTNINATISSRATQTSVDDVPTNAELATAFGTADDAVLAQVALVKAKTDLIPASPAAVSDIPTATQNADALLNRNMASVSDTNARSPLNALRFLRNKWTLTGTTLSVKEEDDSTEAWTAEVSTTPGADPITGSDPA